MLKGARVEVFMQKIFTEKNDFKYYTYGRSLPELIRRQRALFR
jgi:hypothetical protein